MPTPDLEVEVRQRQPHHKLLLRRRAEEGDRHVHRPGLEDCPRSGLRGGIFERSAGEPQQDVQVESLRQRDQKHQRLQKKFEPFQRRRSDKVSFS
jgi:hypothetical protein